jgi:hypothetical protein
MISRQAIWVAALTAVVVLAINPLTRGAVVTVTDAPHNAVAGSEAAAAANVAAFQSAATAAGSGGTIIVPDGVFYIDDSLSWNGILDLTLMAQNSGDATIRRDSTGVQQMSLLFTRRGYVVDGLIFDGNRTTTPINCYGIRVDLGDDVMIKNCTIMNNPYDGILVGNDRYGLTVDGCTITANFRQGLAVTDANHDIKIMNTHFSGNADSGLDFEPDNRHIGDCTVSGCTFDSEELIFVGSSFYPWNITVSGCDFLNGSTVFSTLAMNLSFTGNTFSGGSRLLFNTAHTTDDTLGKVNLSGNTGLAASNGSNLLTNGDFDSWPGGSPTGWSSSGSGTASQGSPKNAIGGGSSAHLSATSNSVSLQQTVAVTGDTDYTFGGYISADGGRSHVAFDDPTLLFEFLDGGASVVKSVTLQGFYDNLDYKQFEKVMAVGRSPAGAVNLRVTVNCTSSGANLVQAFFDELFVNEGVLQGGADLTDGQVIYRFDFEPEYRDYSSSAVDSRFTMPDSIHIDPNSTYNAQKGYGFFFDDPGAIAGRRRLETLSENIRGLDFVAADSTADEFRVDLPNGNYFVTFAGGDIDVVETQQRFLIENDLYRMVDGVLEPDPNAPLFIFDIGINNEVSVITPDRELAGGSGNIRSFGNPTPVVRELLYLRRQRVAVSDGQLNVQNFSNGPKYYNWLEIAPAVPETCADVVAAGLNSPGDLDEDCDVDMDDLNILFAGWLSCEPDGAGCL